MERGILSVDQMTESIKKKRAIFIDLAFKVSTVWLHLKYEIVSLSLHSLKKCPLNEKI